MLVIATVALTRASRRPGERSATTAFVVVLAMIPYFAGTIFCALITPLAMEMSDGSGIGGVAVGVGVACVLLGGLLMIIGLTDMAR